MNVEQYFAVETVGTALVITPKCRGGAFAEEASRVVWPDVLSQVVAAEGGVVVNMESLKFFGSTMLDLIVNVNKLLNPAGRKLALAGISPTGMEVLKIARFDRLIEICDSVEAAVAAVA